MPLPGAKVEQICLQPIRAPGGFLSRVHGVYLGPLCITPMGRGGAGGADTDMKVLLLAVQ